MITFYEIKKTANSSVFKVTATVLLFVCVLLSYLAIRGDETVTYSKEELQKSYDEQMRFIIDSAERGLKNLDGLGKDDDYAHSYYETVIKLYTGASNGKVIESESAVGWDSLLTSNGILLLSLAMAISVGAISVFEEKRTGSVFLVFASKNGRAKTGAAKAASVIILPALFCILFTAVTVAVYFAAGHLSSGFAEIQTAQSFRFSPYNITLWRCLLYITGARVLLSALFGIISAIFSELFGSYVLIITAGIIPAAVEYVIYMIKFVGVDIFIKNVNIFSFGGSYLWERYYSVHLFGCADALGVNIFLFVLLTVFLSGVFITLFSVRTKRQKTLSIRIKQKKAKKSVYNVTPKTLLGWEIKKNLLSVPVLASVLICTAAFCAVSVNTYGSRVITDELIYRQYCERFEKMTLEDAIKAISEEDDRIERGANLRAEASEKHSNGEISIEEYSEMMEEYGYCLAHRSAIERCVERASYLNGLDRSGKREIRFVYDGILNELLSEDFSFILIILLTICISDVFSREHGSGIDQILRVCKKGRSDTRRTKYLYTVSVTAAFCLLFTLTEAAVCAANGAFAAANASVLSLTAAKHVTPDLSIGTYLLIMYLLRFASYELFAVMLTSLSGITKKNVTATVFAFVFVFVPFMIGKVGTMPVALDLSAFLSANRVLLSPDKSVLDFIVLPAAAALLFCADRLKSRGGV